MINLSPEAPKTSGIDLLDDAIVVPTPEHVQRKLRKHTFALENRDLKEDDLLRYVWGGHDRRLRELVAGDEAIQDRRRRQGVVQQLLRQAAVEGRELSSDEYQYVMNSQETEGLEPENILERLYARRLVEEASTAETAPEYSEAYAEDPDQADAIIDQSVTFLTNQEIALDILDTATGVYDKTSWSRWGGDMLKSMVPFYSWAKLTDQLEDAPTSTVLTGTNIQEQIRHLYTLPPEEFRETLEAAVNQLMEDNVLEGLYFAEAAVSYASSAELWDNMFFGLDIVDVGTLMGAVAASRLVRRMRGVATANARPDATDVDRVAATGDLAGAAEKRAVERLESIGAVDAQGVPVTPAGAKVNQEIAQLSEEGFGLFDPQNITRNAGSLSGERTRRILEQLTENQSILDGIMTDVSHVRRVSPRATEALFERAEQIFRRTNNKLEDAIVEVRPVNDAAEVFGGVDYIEVLMGRKDATSFAKPTQAEFHARNMYRLRDGTYDVVERDGNYFIRMTQTVDETDPVVAPLRVGTDNTTRESLVNTWIGALRNPDHFLSKEHSMWRKVATYGATGTLGRIAEASKAITKLSSNEIDRLRDVMDDARFLWRDVTNPDGTKTRAQGRFYHSPAELEQAYLARHGKLPTDGEQTAYWTFRQIMDFDYKFRNVSMWRDKARQGIDQKSIAVPLQTEGGQRSMRYTDYFESRFVENLPDLSSEPFNVAFVMPNGRTNLYMSSKLKDPRYAREAKALQEAIESGDAKIIQVADSSDPVIRDALNTRGDPVHYIVVKDVQTKPLSMNQIAYNEGGHWNTPTSGAYLKQPRVHKGGVSNTQIYDGDVTAHWFGTGAQARKFADAYNTARQMIIDGITDHRLDTFIDSHLPYKSGAEFRKLFRSETNPDAPFSLDAPFAVTEQGQSVGDVIRLEDTFGQVHNSRTSPHNLTGRINSQYAQERGERLTSIHELGTEANPIYKLDAAPLMDSFQSISRSAAGIARSRYLEDYQHRAVEDWVAQFADVIDAPLDQVRANPLHYLREAVWREGADTAKIAAAQNSRRAINNLIGTQNELMQAWNWALKKTADEIYKARGLETPQIIAPHMWGSRTDPATLARSAVFHTKLGLFNPVQFPLQGMAVIHAAAIDGNPVRAAQANFLYWSMRTRGLAETNPGAQSFIGRATSRALGVSEDTVEEMYQAWKKSGMHIVDGEYNRLDDWLNPNRMMSQTPKRQFLRSGEFFFKEGNNWHRGVSFSTAFLRWRAENPTARLTNDALAKIVERADLMYINMSRASSPATQQGALSVPTQFFAYHQRMAEQMLGQTLTWPEKLRLMTTYSAVWGVPVGTAGMVGGTVWPMHDSIRQTALEAGMDLDTNAYTKFLMEGGASMLLEYATGMNFDMGNRMGPGGLSWFQDILDGNFVDVGLGASGSALGSMLQKMSPFGWAATQVFAMENDYYPIEAQDFIAIGKELSGFNNFERAYWAYNAGEWIDSQGRTVKSFEGGMSASAAVIAAVTGAQPQDVADMYLMQRTLRQEQEAQATFRRQALVEYRRALKAAADGEHDQAYNYFKRARIILEGSGFTPMERSEAFRMAIRDNEELFEKISREFATSSPARLERYLEMGSREE